MKRTIAYFRRRGAQLTGPLSAAFGSEVTVAVEAHKAGDCKYRKYRLQIVHSGDLHLWPTRARYFHSLEFDAYLDGIEEGLEMALRRAELDPDRDTMRGWLKRWFK